MSYIVLLFVLLLHTPMVQSQSSNTTKSVNDTATRVTGIVLDVNDEPMIGASIKLINTNIFSRTNDNGEFVIYVPSDISPTNINLEINYIGMLSQQVKYRGRTMTIILEEDGKMLKDVVITGYQQIDRRYSTSSITSVKADEILTPGITTIDQALLGRVPDLVVTQNSGAAGATSRLRIRGTSTVLGNREPLWVVDGFIVTDPVNISPEQLNDPDFVNLIGNAIAGVNPKDIDRIDVLKDASATALYGTRAANGVIVVTTKQGQEGPISISYDHTSRLTKSPSYNDNNTNLMNSYERVSFGKNLTDIHYVFPNTMALVGYEGAYMRFQRGQINYSEFVDAVRIAQTSNTDWIGLLTQNTYSGQHTLQLSGGTRKLRYFTSFSYDRDNGVAKDEYSQRYAMRSNINATITPKLRFNVNISGNVQKRNHAPSEINLLDYAFKTSRTIPAQNIDGSFFYFPHRAYGVGVGSNQFNYSILNEMENSYNHYNGNGIMSNLNLLYRVKEALELSIGGSYSRNNSLQETWWGEKTHYVSLLRNAEIGEAPPKGDLGNSFLPYGGILLTNNTLNESFTARTQLNYNLFLGKDKKNLINFLMGGEMYSNSYTGYNDENRGFMRTRGLQFVQDVNLEDYPLYKNWINKSHRKKTHNISNQVSMYATASFSLSNLFTVNANARIDYSNKFGNRAKERFLPVWSASGRWNIHNTIFKDVENISEIVLRGSYGRQGNMLDTESPNLVLKQGTVDPYYNENVSVIARYPNPNLRWEQTQQVNASLGVRLFEHRLGVEAEYYYKNTDDVFMHVNVLSTNGVKTYVLNGGSVYNKGYNLQLSGVPVRNRDFNWSIYAHISKSRNNVRSSSAEKYELQDYLDGKAVINSYPISSFFSYKYLGLDPTNGTPLIDDYVDKRHLLEGKTLEQTVLTVLENSGTRDPIFTGSLNNTLRYKQFTMSVYVTYSLGAKMRLFNLYEPISAGVKAEANLRSEFLDRWIASGDEKYTDIPAILGPGDPEFARYTSHYSNLSSDKIPTFGSNVWRMYDLSTLRVVPADYLRLSSVSFRYRFDEKILKKTPLQQLELSLNGMNLFYISNKALKGQDPMQAGFAMPQISVRPTFSFQFNAKF